MQSFPVPGVRAILAGMLLVVCSLASATVTYTVNSTADLVDSDLSDGVCATSAGSCTLRAAVMQSNVVAAASPTIVLPAGTYAITRPVLGSDGSDEGDFDFTTPTSPTDAVTTLVGSGAATTVIDANQLDRAFNIEGGRSIAMCGVTITNGRAPVSDDVGGAIVSNGMLNLTDVHLTASSAQWGGCLYLSTDRATFDRIEVSQCSAGGGGDIDFVHGTVTMSNSPVAGNTASSGGGILVDSGAITMVDSTVYGNAALGSGGGIYAIGSMWIYNTTKQFDHRRQLFSGLAQLG